MMVKYTAVIVFLAGSVFTLAAGPVIATDCTQPGNLVPNCGFASDLSSLYFTADSETHIPAGGAATPGAVELDRHDAVEAIEAFSACLTVSPTTKYDLGASFRLPSGTGVFDCTVDVIQYSDGSCGAYDSQSNHDFTPGFDWSEISATMTTGASVASVGLRMACFSSSDFVIRIDDVLFGRNLVFAPIFADDFESGDTRTWSTSAGLSEGSVCATDAQCATGLLCCYPCGIQGCDNVCSVPQPGGGCFMYP